MSQTGHVEFMEGTVTSLDNRFIDVEITGISILYKGKPSILSITRDIIERKGQKKLCVQLARS